MNKEKSKIVTKKFEIDKDFVDPLLYDNTESFDEIEVEEAPFYMNVHLGCKLLHDDAENI